MKQKFNVSHNFLRLINIIILFTPSLKNFTAPLPVLSQSSTKIIYFSHIGDEDASVRGGIRILVEQGNPEKNHDFHRYATSRSFEAICKSLQTNGSPRTPSLENIHGFGYFDVTAKGCTHSKILQRRIGPASFLSIMKEIRSS